MDYNNPTALLPQLGWKPQGFMAGTGYASQQQDYAQQMGLANIVKELEIMKKKADYEDYQANAPVREAERGYKIQDFGDRKILSPFETNAKVEEANVRAQDAQPALEHKQFQRGEEKATVSRELTGNYLSAILNSKKSPAEMMMAWRDQAVPDLERQRIKIPDQYKNMDVQTMMRINEYLTNNSKFRQATMQQGQKEGGLNSRNDADNATAIEVAKIRAAAAHKEQMTAAQQKEQARQQYRDQILERMMTEQVGQMKKGLTADGGRGFDQKQYDDMRNRAEIESHQLYGGGNKYGGADAAGQLEGVKADIKQYRMELMQADEYTSQDEVKEAVKDKKIKHGQTFLYGGKLFRYNAETGKADLVPSPRQTGSPGFQVP